MFAAGFQVIQPYDFLRVSSILEETGSTLLSWANIPFSVGWTTLYGELGTLWELEIPQHTSEEVVCWGKLRAQGDRNRWNRAISKTRLKWKHFKHRHRKKEMPAEQHYEGSCQSCNGELAHLKCLYTNTCRMRNEQQGLCSLYAWRFFRIQLKNFLKPWACWSEVGGISTSRQRLC